jgi:hypothetical protein
MVFFRRCRDPGKSAGPFDQKATQVAFNTIGHHADRCAMVENSFTGKTPVRER